ncbi:MAG: hypothetical protein RMI56_00365 [Sulfolobales archaeon]|nr:hypothetical protein [Sulfolobales archaeon]MDW8082233.1 hypothetical protein [Sulfolobales archaeon]
MRGSVSALAAAFVIIATSLTLLSIHLRLSRESVEVLREVRDEAVRAYSVDVRWVFEGDRVVLHSSSPARVLAVLSISKGGVEVLRGEFTMDSEFAIEIPRESKVLIVLEGGRHLLIDREKSAASDSGEQPGDALYELRASSRLLPLLARFLDPVDYVAISESRVPLNLSRYRLHSHYKPVVTWTSRSSTRYCYGSLLYVELSWNSTHWVATYRKCASDGPELETLRVSRSATELPYREYLYHRECSSSGGVRYCFNVYATARGRCVYSCGNPQNSRWFLEVGARVEYRLEPLEPGAQVLVVVNRTLLEHAISRRCASCVYYLSSAGLWCWRCSSDLTAGVCSVSSPVPYLRGPGPVFVWDIFYEESYETYYNNDDGYALGAWYPYVELKPPLDRWRTFGSYSYALGDSVVLSFYVAGTYSEDFLARASGYQYGYYRISFDLILDEGGLGGDSRTWDYSALVFLLKPPAS